MLSLIVFFAITASFQYNILVTHSLSSTKNNDEHQFFNSDSCASRLPVMHNTGLIKKSFSDNTPFSLKVSTNTYDIGNNGLTRATNKILVTVEHHRKSDKIESLIIQGVLVDQDNFVIGTWTKQPANTKAMDCFSAKDTVVENGQLDEEALELEWQILPGDKLLTQEFSAPIIFIATIITSDSEGKQYYWPDVKSEIIFRKKMPENSAEDELDAATSNKKIKRDSSKHFLTSTSQCGIRRSCYISPKDCDIDPKTCNFVLSWDFDGQLINYELTGLSSMWVAVVFSQDQYLGDDNLVVCNRDPQTENDKVTVDHYFKNASDPEIVQILADDGLFKKFGVYNIAGYIYCKFSRAKTSTNKLITDLSQPHYIYVERGGSNELISEKLAQRFQPSETQVDFGTSIYVARSERSWLVKVHAILAIIAWIFLGSIGILMARYYKPLWPNHILHAHRVWFSFHRPIMIFVTLLTLISFLFALIELEWTWSENGHDLLHAILGLIVIICSILNPILGCIRPKPDSRLRCLFFWCHWLIGTIAYCLAVPTIFIGMDLSKSDIPNWCAWLLFAWVIFHIIVEIILEIHYCCSFARDKERYAEYNAEYDKKNKITIKKRNPPGYRWKPHLLFFYAVVTAIVVSALVIALILFDL